MNSPFSFNSIHNQNEYRICDKIDPKLIARARELRNTLCWKEVVSIINNEGYLSAVRKVPFSIETLKIYILRYSLTERLNEIKSI